MSSRQSTVRITLASRLSGSPAQKRGSPAQPVKAIRRPSGEKAGLPTEPCGAGHTSSASPPSTRIMYSRASSPSPRSLVKATVRPSGEKTGEASLPAPEVSRRGRPPR